ncbi:hypothetical protein F7Q91_03215 [Vibrio chagasii]|uniref:Uncharacterized protein n=1 Tax=Vibrio chagasii TaxID=170679 RepID=A0A7V7NWX9_9VIBR|nr:hypothetical protein [Vibrio chagasii]KAB0482432.1 hypothetical protein F7Q91_03215 [Vibrio chagasii]
MVEFLSNIGIKSGLPCTLADRSGTYYLWGIDWNARQLLIELETNWHWFPVEKVTLDSEVDLIKQLDEYKQSCIEDDIIGVDWLENRVLQVMPQYIDWVSISDSKTKH